MNEKTRILVIDDDAAALRAMSRSKEGNVMYRTTTKQPFSCILLMLLGVLIPLAGVNQAAAQAAPGKRVVYMGMILGMGGLGDRSFNDSAYEGLRDAQREFGIRFDVVEFVAEDVNLEALRNFARQEYDLIIGIGFENRQNIETVAQEFPDINFAVIDVVAEGKNIASIVYREQEGDFLMGVLAAMLTKNHKVGVIGGMDIPVIQRILQGFTQGVAYQDPTVEIVAGIAGTFTDPEVGKTLALGQYRAGVDIIYNAAGRTGLGIIEAAKETGNLTIGTSGDQRYLAPGHVVGNRPKRVDTAVLTLVKDIQEHRFMPGIRSFGLQERGLLLGPFDPELVTDAMQQRLEQLQRDIIAGKITITVPE